MSTYSWSQYLAKLLPWWLQTGEGGLVQRTVATVLGGFTERARQGLLAHGPTTCPDDAIQYFCRDRGIVRGINEPREAIGLRLVRFLDDRATQGNAFALHAQLRAYMQADVMVRTVDSRGNWYTTAAGGARSVVIDTGNWDWDGAAASRWSRFWVIIYPSGGLPWAASVGGTPAAWPSGGTIGTTATPEQVASVRSIIRQWQPDGTRCEWIIIAYDAASFDPTAPEPDGTWGDFGYDAGGGSYEVARHTTARYWKGVDGAP